MAACDCGGPEAEESRCGTEADGDLESSYVSTRVLCRFEKEGRKWERTEFWIVSWTSFARGRMHMDRLATMVTR